MTALMLAAGKNSNPEVITTLVKADADPNARNENGMTALMLAAGINSNPEVISILLDAGADPKIKDRSGMMAMAYMKSNEKLKNTDAYWKLNDATY